MSKVGPYTSFFAKNPQEWAPYIDDMWEKYRRMNKLFVPKPPSSHPPSTMSPNIKHRLHRYLESDINDINISPVSTGGASSRKYKRRSKRTLRKSTKRKRQRSKSAKRKYQRCKSSKRKNV
jgi:hypothetical protein